MNTSRESPERLLLRVGEAADLCGISKSHLYALLQTGAVPVIRIGRSARIPRAWLEAWIVAQVDAWEAASEGREAGRR